MAPPSPTGNWIGILLFVLIAVAGITLFGVRAGELITLLVKARRENRTDHIDDRIGSFFLVVLGQSGVLRDPIPGIAHFFTFWVSLLSSLACLISCSEPSTSLCHSSAITTDPRPRWTSLFFLSPFPSYSSLPPAPPPLPT